MSSTPFENKNEITLFSSPGVYACGPDNAKIYPFFSEAPLGAHYVNRMEKGISPISAICLFLSTDQQLVETPYVTIVDLG
jgi:hypothetical protein